MTPANTADQRAQLLNEARRHRREADDHRRAAQECEARALHADHLLRRMGASTDTPVA